MLTLASIITGFLYPRARVPPRVRGGGLALGGWPLTAEPVMAAKDLAGKRLAEADVFEGRGVAEVAVVG